jgi:hypothetical protein
VAEMTIRTNAERGLLLAILLSAVTLVLEIAGRWATSTSGARFCM